MEKTLLAAAEDGCIDRTDLYVLAIAIVVTCIVNCGKLLN